MYNLLNEIYIDMNVKHNNDNSECMIASLMHDKCSFIKSRLSHYFNGVEFDVRYDIDFDVVVSGVNNSGIIRDNECDSEASVDLFPTFLEPHDRSRVLNNKKVDAGPFVTIYKKEKFSTTGNDQTMTIMGLSIVSSMLTSIVLGKYSISVPYTHYLISGYDQVMQALVVMLPDGYEFVDNMELKASSILSKNTGFPAPYFKYSEGKHTISFAFFKRKFNLTGVTAHYSIIDNALKKCFDNNTMKSMIRSTNNNTETKKAITVKRKHDDSYN